ncbi:hypothetical protein GHT06_022047 [Daphnia sinensis]|uniref:Uncharacterized protein n=1 Tax=Daphnia sinensis TaxID=1820382 RepID=A0AAD5KX80_9CRUS|nr:hypothetical protein GHT06_022047 [Daphnia sinensis]
MDFEVPFDEAIDESEVLLEETGLELPYPAVPYGQLKTNVYDLLRDRVFPFTDGANHRLRNLIAAPSLCVLHRFVTRSISFDSHTFFTSFRGLWDAVNFVDRNAAWSACTADRNRPDIQRGEGRKEEEKCVERERESISGQPPSRSA